MAREGSFPTLLSASVAGLATQRAIVTDLVARGVAYRAFVRMRMGGEPELRRPLGVRLYHRIQNARARVR